MSFFNQGTEIYPHHSDVVYHAVMQSVTECQYGIVNADHKSGFLLVQTSNSERHWNGQLSVSILQLGGNTQVSISGPLSNGTFFSSNASSGAMAISRTRLERKIKSILGRTAFLQDVSGDAGVAVAESKPESQWQQAEAPGSLTASIADEISKLKRLLDDDAITKIEYQKLKKKLVEG